MISIVMYNAKYTDKYNEKYNDKYNDDNDSASSFCLLGTICLRTSDHLPDSAVWCNASAIPVQYQCNTSVVRTARQGSVQTRN